MAGPWEEYAAQPAAKGPWEEYQSTPPPAAPGLFDPGQGGLADIPYIGTAARYLDDLTSISGDTVTRGYGDKLAGPEAQARTAAARQRTSDWAEAPAEIASAIASTPYAIGSTLGGGVAGAIEGGLSAYGHQQGWTPEWGNIAAEAGQGALLGSGAAKAGEWAGRGWNRLAGNPPVPTGPAPPVGAVGSAVQNFGNAPRTNTLLADLVLTQIGMPPVVTGASRLAKTVGPLFNPGVPMAEAANTSTLRDLFSKAMAAQGRSP